MTRAILTRLTVARSVSTVLVGAALLLVGGCASAGSAGSKGGGSSAGDPGRVGGRYVLSLGDADLPADVLGSPALSERTPGAAGRDTLTVVSLPIREPVTPCAQVEVSSSGIGYPGCIAVSNDGRFAYVVASRGPWSEGSNRSVDALPVGDTLTSVNLTDPLNPRVLGTSFVGEEPRAIAVHPAGDLLAIVTRNPRNQLVMVPITATGAAGEATAWPLLGLDDDAAAPSAVAWHPGGRLLAVALADRAEVAFYHFAREADGALAIAAAGTSGPGAIGRTPVLATFTPDGRHLLVLDANRSGRGLAATVPGGPGQILTIGIPEHVTAANQPPGGWKPVAVSSAPVGPAPTGMTLSPDGGLIACVTAQPGSESTTSAAGGGGALCLLRLDRGGVLNRLGEYTLGATPAGVAFDAAGRHVLVSQFGSADPEASDGEISFWRVIGARNEPRLQQQDFFVGIGSGPHGTLIVR